MMASLGLTPLSTSKNCCSLSLCEPQPPPLPLTTTSARDPPALAGRSGSVSCGVTAPFPWILVCTRPRVPSRSGVSVSPSPVEALQSNPAGLQRQFLWGFLLLLLDSQVGKVDVWLRTFTPVGELL